MPSNRYELMKRILFGLLTISAVCTSQAQLFTHEGLTGAALGAALGAAIGHGAGHHAGEGAAIGAASGFVLGSLAHEARRDRYYYGVGYDYAYPSYGYGVYYAPRVYAPPVGYYQSYPTYSQPAQQTQSAPQNVTIINNYYNSSPMSGANALFGR